MTNTYDIFVEKTGTERYSIDADTPQNAFARYEAGECQLKDDETKGVGSIKIIDRATGQEFDPDAFDDEPSPEPKEYPVRLWATARVVCEETVTAKSPEEAIEIASKLSLDDFNFEIEGIEGDETVHVDAPDGEIWGGPANIDMRADGEPFSWDAVQVVKDLAALDELGNETFTRQKMKEITERCRRLCSKSDA